MTIEIRGVKYKVWFQIHPPRSKFETGIVRVFIHPAELQPGPRAQFEGISWCHWRDQFRKEVGRKYALRRAFQEIGLLRTERRAAWNQIWEQQGKLSYIHKQEVKGGGE